jgi:large subunit ribosomal protein L33
MTEEFLSSRHPVIPSGIPSRMGCFWFVESIMREYVWLECTVCGARNYRTEKETRGAERLELKKFCRKERKHTAHKESRKK